MITRAGDAGEIAIGYRQAQANVASQKANLVKAQSAVELAKVGERAAAKNLVQDRQHFAGGRRYGAGDL